MPSSDLFISEIIEGSSNNKAIEIYNGTGAAIDLAASGYSIQIFFNGSPTAGLTINLTGVIQPGDVFVLAQSNANATILAQADQTNGSGWFNGDDAIVLRKGATVIDTFGQIGNDPGAEWGTGLTSTADNTLRRRSEITDGDPTGTDAFDPASQWTGFATDTFDGLGSHSAGGGTPTASVSINSVSVAEGSNGTKELTFTVTRTDTSGAFTVDFATSNGTATVADADYAPTSGSLAFVAGGPATQQVKVVVNGDLLPEGNETFNVTLSNLVVGSGAAVLGTAVGVGTIQNDDAAFRTISAIQGAGHASPFVGTEATTVGVVTAIDSAGTSRGFWMQDPTGDGDTATSDAIFVSTGGVTPAVLVGQTVQVSGVITEFGSGNNLTVTQLTGSAIEVQNGGDIGALPGATILGVGGRMAPTSVIDDDGLTSYNPNQDAVDFYESMEGMLVSVPNTLVVGATASNATWVVADGGVGTTGLNARDGITIQADDFNPERINVFWDSGVSPGTSPQAVMGDTLGTVNGVVGYFGGNYEVIATSIGQAPAGQPLPREVTALAGDSQHVTIAAYNLENLDPGDTDAKFTRLALDIIQNLGGPNIIGVEEIQDSNGAAVGGDLSGAATLNKLIAKIAELGGPTYSFVEVAPTQANTTGGQEHANIRNAFLYDASKVQYVAGSVELITGAAYDGSRKPLAAEFTFNGEVITVIDLHSTSRLGSEQLFGNHQPATNAGEAARIAQSAGVKAYVDALLAADPYAKVAVMGDFNGFQFETSLTLLEQGGALTNLSNLLPAEERYTYVFEGNSQQIDHLLVSGGFASGAQFDIVHMNSGQLATAARATDHDAVLARLFVNAKPTAVADAATVLENQNVTIDVLANDTDANAGDTKTLISVAGGALGGKVSIVGGKVVYSANSDAIDQLKQPLTAVDTITYQVQDSHGAISTGTVSVTVKGVADAPTRNGTANADTLNGTALEDVINGQGGNDRLVGNLGADTLNGGLGNDTLVGGDGADRFVFSGAFGKDVVSDFQANDVIRLDAVQFADFGAVQAASSQVGANVLITLDPANTITLTGVTLANLNSGDFLFV